MTDGEKLEFLAGRVHALVGFATAVIPSHPNPALLAEHLEKVGAVNLAQAETAVVHEEYVLGVEDMRDRLKDAVAIAMAQRTTPE
jgi:hypothetical protein